MHGAVPGVNFFSAVERHRAHKPIAACHPFPGFTFTKDNGIECRAIQRLHADRATAALVKRIELHPCFERLLLQIDRKWLSPDPGVFAVQYKAAIFNPRAAVRSCGE